MEEFKIFSCGTQAVISSIGGTVLSFSMGIEHILYPYSINELNKARGGMPICAPWFGSSELGGKHGFLRQSPMEVIRVEGDLIELTTSHKGMEKYPWHINYTLKYRVKQGYLSLEITTQRLKDNIPGLAPFNIGFHPYFIGDARDCMVMNDLSDYYDASFSATAKSSPLKHDFFTTWMERREIKVYLRGMFLNGTSQVYFWSDDTEKYVCIEPVLYDAKLFNTKKGVFLKEGESLNMRIELLLK